MTGHRWLRTEQVSSAKGSDSEASERHPLRSLLVRHPHGSSAMAVLVWNTRERMIIYPLVIQHSHGKWPIIDGLPIKMLNNQMVPLGTKDGNGKSFIHGVFPSFLCLIPGGYIDWIPHYYPKWVVGSDFRSRERFETSSWQFGYYVCTIADSTGTFDLWPSIRNGTYHSWDAYPSNHCEIIFIQFRSWTITTKLSLR